jgi:hypothetical protein
MSPTVQTLLIGFVTLLVMGLVGWLFKSHAGIAIALKIFFPVWFAYALYHMSVGVSHGYSIVSELPFLLINFSIPALVAWFVLRKITV